MIMVPTVVTDALGRSNNAIKFVPDRWSSTGRLSAAAYGWRHTVYGGGCWTASHWVISAFGKTMERRKHNGLSHNFGLEAGL